MSKKMALNVKAILRVEKGIPQSLEIDGIGRLHLIIMDYDVLGVEDDLQEDNNGDLYYEYEFISSKP